MNILFLRQVTKPPKRRLTLQSDQLKKVSTEKSENQSEKLGFSSIIPQANGIIEKIQKGIT